MLDNKSKRRLASLSRLGLSSILKEVIDVERAKVKSESNSEEDKEQESCPQQETSEPNRDANITRHDPLSLHCDLRWVAAT